MATKPSPGRRGQDRPYTDDERDRVRTLHAEGLGRNAIARVAHIHQRKVSAIAAELGLSFVRAPHVRAAVEAKVIDAKAKRAALALALLDDAERMRQQLFQPHIAFNFGGKDNTYEEREIPEPTARDKRDLAMAISTFADRAMKLDEYDRDTDGGDGRSVIGDIMSGLKQAWLDAQPTE